MTSAAALTPRRERFARRRLYRLMTMSLGITAVVEAASVVPAMTSQAATLTPLYCLVAVVVVTVPAIVALVVFSRASLVALRWIWRVQALGMLAVYLAIPLALGTTRVPVAFGLTWVAELEIIPACAAVLAWRLRGVLVYLVVWQTTMFSVAWLCCDDPLRGRAFGDALRQLFFITMFMCLAFALLRAGRLLDAAVDDAVRESRIAAGADARRAARGRVQMLVHDSIIVALLAYANGAGRERVQAEAAAALAQMREGLRDRRSQGTPQQVAWRLQALTTRMDPGVQFDYSFTGDDLIPGAVSAAFEEALAEALRNSLRHASDGAPVNRQVRVTVSAEGIDLVVLDDGAGFDPARIDATRLGVRQGIVHRMRSIEGGDAQVRSTRGYGTAVSLSWRRP